MQTYPILTGKVRDLMAEVFGVDESDIPEDVNQHDFAQWTSLEHLTLLVALEEEFDITFSTAEMSAMNSIPAITSLLEKRNV